MLPINFVIFDWLSRWVFFHLQQIRLWDMVSLGAGGYELNKYLLVLKLWRLQTSQWEITEATVFCSLRYCRSSETNVFFHFHLTSSIRWKVNGAMNFRQSFQHVFSHFLQQLQNAVWSKSDTDIKNPLFEIMVNEWGPKDYFDSFNWKNWSMAFWSMALKLCKTSSSTLA